MFQRNSVIERNEKTEEKLLSKIFKARCWSKCQHEGKTCKPRIAKWYRKIVYTILFLGKTLNLTPRSFYSNVMMFVTENIICALHNN